MLTFVWLVFFLTSSLQLIILATRFCRVIPNFPISKMMHIFPWKDGWGSFWKRPTILLVLSSAHCLTENISKKAWKMNMKVFLQPKEHLIFFYKCSCMFTGKNRACCTCNIWFTMINFKEYMYVFNTFYRLSCLECGCT